jgi:hypothetical protein
LHDALAILEGLASPKAGEVRMLLENSMQAKSASMLLKLWGGRMLNTTNRGIMPVIKDQITALRRHNA